MDVTISVSGRDSAAEELRSLFTWLTAEEEFRGRASLAEVAPEPGALGGWPEAVVVAVGHGGAMTVLVSAVIAWIRHRTSEVKCTLTRPDGMSVELIATRVRNTDLVSLGELVEQVAAALGTSDIEGSREEID